MANGNGHKEEKENKLPEVKTCPFLKELCTRDECPIFVELVQTVGGLQKKFGACAFPTMVQFLSEMNQRASAFQQSPIQLPRILRG